VARIKGGPNPKPILVLIGDLSQLAHFISSLPPPAWSLMVASRCHCEDQSWKTGVLEKAVEFSFYQYD